MPSTHPTARVSGEFAVIARRRNTELVLILFARGLGVLGTLQVGWATGEGMPAHLWITAIVALVIALTMHIVVRLRASYADPIL